MKKPLIVMLLVGAIAIGLLAMLVVGLTRVDEDGREGNGARVPGHAVTDRSAR